MANSGRGSGRRTGDQLKALRLLHQPRRVAQALASVPIAPRTVARVRPDPGRGEGAVFVERGGVLKAHHAVNKALATKRIRAAVREIVMSSCTGAQAGR